MRNFAPILTLGVLKHYLLVILACLMMVSCGEYQRVLKSTDSDYKLDFARRAFEQKRYVQASTVLADIIPKFRGNEKGEEALYLLALSNYENKDYQTACSYFKNYYTRYPKGKYTELARFYSGYGYYLDSPEPQLDQSGTIKGIEELQSFLDYFPRSNRVAEAQQALFDLQDKLTLKQLMNAQLYYNLGNYQGNNYRSAIITAKNAVKDYPYSKYKEDLELLVLKAMFQEANQSIEEKKTERFREVMDEYYGFITTYPDTSHKQEIENIRRIAAKYQDE